MSARVDKWLWSVRIFKTRSLATEACKSGKVSMDGIAIKASKELKVGDIVMVRKEMLNLQLKVLALSEKRMGANLVDQFMTDLTPAEEYERVRLIRDNGFEVRSRGIGRPTKKDRRTIDFLKDLN
jgi:ribosome-associated heat shock protein Hsp15